MEINQFMLRGKNPTFYLQWNWPQNIFNLQVIAVLNQDRLTLCKLSLVDYLNMISFFTPVISDLKDDRNVL